MMSRWTPVWLVFLVLAIGAVWSFRDAGDDVPTKSDRVVAGVGKMGVAGAAGGDDMRFLGVSDSGALSEVRNAISVKPVVTMGSGAASLLAEEIALRALAGAEGLSLTEREWTALASVTLNTQAVRHAYEAEIAVATMGADGNGRLEIPEYAEAGAALRTEFYAALLKELGESSAMEVVKKLSEQLESRFAGFGAAVQTLDVSLRDGRVTRTVAYWNEADLGGETRMRRETIFPQMEDPDGLQWGPLLERVEAGNGQGKRSSRG